MRAAVMLSVLGVAGLVSACAPMQYTRAELDGRVVCDTARMEQIERAARRENKEVHWVSCPLATLRVVS